MAAGKEISYLASNNEYYIIDHSRENYTTRNIDMVLVPLAAVDVEGNRVGYGKGYCDKFLAVCRPDCLKVGLSFFGPVERFSDVQDHDIPLDVCIIPNEIVEFK